MAIAEFKEDLIRRVPVDTPEVLRILDRHIKTPSLRRDLVLLTGQFEDISRERRIGSLNFEDTMRLHTVKRDAIIDLIQRLEVEDLKERKKAFKILVLCSIDIDKTYMEQYFAALPIDNVDVYCYNEPYALDDYGLIIFDNHRIGRINAQKDIENLGNDEKALLDLMDKSLQKSPKWIIYFGDYNYILNDYREVTNAANNKFSLYNCINYMKAFIEDYQVGRKK
jgi:hypothetical protein